MDPRRERALSAKRRKPLPRADEHVLHEVARVALVAHHAPAERVDGRRRVRGTLLEGVHVALLGAAHDVVDATGVGGAATDSTGVRDRARMPIG